MSKHPAISTLVAYGAEAERILLPILSQIVQDGLKKTDGCFNTMDFQGKRTFAELKRRSKDWSYTDERIRQEGWLIPSCKILRGWEELSKGKDVFFFYFWMCDKSLWFYQLREGDFTGPKDHFVPKNHYDQMLHVTIPEEKWTFVTKVENLFEEEQCLITSDYVL